MRNYFSVIAGGLAVIALSFAACESESLTESDMQTQTSAIEKSVEVAVGEHKDIELPIDTQQTYAVSSATTSSVGRDINLTNATNINYAIQYVSHAARPVLRIVGVQGGIEAVVVQAANNANGQVSTMRVIVTVTPSGGNNELIGGTPCSGSDCGDGGGGGGPGDPPTPPGPTDPGDKPTQDPDACTTAGFYYVEDNYRDIEGKFSPDLAAYLRSLMSGNVDSLIRLYYPNKYPMPANRVYTNLGRYLVNLKMDSGAVVRVEFDLQLSQHLFGQDKKYFYVETNGYCLRGDIPASFMSPPSKGLIWVTR